MLEGKRIIAIVPARSGSKGIPHKNMSLLGGVSLIGWAGKTLGKLDFIDRMIISTDSPEYVREGERYGLEAPFLRPADLSTDEAGAIETIEHALREAEKCYSMVFDVILIIEPTSPFRFADDIERITRRLLSSGADSVVAVSPLSPKAHPKKVLEQQDGLLRHYLPEGKEIKGRQMLEPELYWRNGVCYALTRDCLLSRKAIFTENTLAEVTLRPIVNIDDPLDLDWAEFLLREGLVERPF